MKNLLVVLFLLLSVSACAQNYPEYGLNRIRIVEPDKIIQAEIKPEDNAPHVKPDKYYYWYSANAIHATQGGYSGRLLNGQYNEYYINKNLKVQGIFKNGLKDGIWKSWNADGTLQQLSNWKNGIVFTSGAPSFFNRINIFRKKRKNIRDTTVKKINH